PAETSFHPGARLVGGVVVEHGGGGEVAAHHAHAGAVLQVDGRVQDHGRHARKLARSCAPRPCDFSGGNCTPATLPLSTAAVKRPPWSVAAATSAASAGKMAKECVKYMCVPAGRPAKRAAGIDPVSAFQPMWGILQCGSAGSSRRTSPASQPSPG